VHFLVNALLLMEVSRVMGHGQSKNATFHGEKSRIREQLIWINNWAVDTRWLDPGAQAS
jgi:hypothetical protein